MSVLHVIGADYPSGHGLEDVEVLKVLHLHAASSTDELNRAPASLVLVQNQAHIGFREHLESQRPKKLGSIVTSLSDYLPHSRRQYR